MKLRRSMLCNVFWFVALFCLFFQFPFPNLSKYIIPFIAVFMILEIPNMQFPKVKGWGVLFGAYVFYLSLSMALSIFTNASISTVFRFLLILLILPVTLMVKDKKFDDEWKIFKFLSLCKGLVILGYWIHLFILQDYTEIRAWVLYEIQAGDIYIIGGIPRIQVLGNSLFVLGFILEYIKTQKITLYLIIMLLSGLASGNTAYVLGYVVFLACIFVPKLFLWLQKRNWKSMIFFPILCIATVFVVIYGIEQLEVKADWSNVIRMEQASVLLNTNPIWGSGLGHAITASTTFREYYNNIYFELQTLYIFNQIGSVGIVMFYLLTIMPLRNLKMQLVPYIVYLIYTFWNPYCFDSNHLIALLLIGNMYKDDQLRQKSIMEEENNGQSNRNCYIISSR